MNSKENFYKQKYLKYKYKYLKLKGGYSPNEIDDLRENTRFYEEKFIKDYAYLPDYTHSFVKIVSKPTSEVLYNIFNFHKINNYEQKTFCVFLYFHYSHAKFTTSTCSCDITVGSFNRFLYIFISASFDANNSLLCFESSTC